MSTDNENARVNSEAADVVGGLAADAGDVWVTVCTKGRGRTRLTFGSGRRKDVDIKLTDAHRSVRSVVGVIDVVDGGAVIRRHRDAGDHEITVVDRNHRVIAEIPGAWRKFANRHHARVRLDEFRVNVATLGIAQLNVRIER